MQAQSLKLKAQNLRKRYPKFIYKKYNYKISGNNLEIFFDFGIKPNYDSRSAGPWNFPSRQILKFQPKIIIENINKKSLEKIGDSALKNLIFNLGLMEIPSYWKATCSPEILVKAGSLNKGQINWWKDLILKGMGQFFYENRINFLKSNFLKITDRGEKYEIFSGQLKNRCLVPVGGGKDSIVTLELLKKQKKEIKCFGLNPTDSALRIMKIGGCKNPILVKRKIDPFLLKLNRQGFLNGHTPFSAYLAFLTILVAVLFDYKYIALSNERSSNEGNVKYLGKNINHQWSKSFEFEKKFRNYSKRYLVKDIEYFSFLRPLYEIQIAKLFSEYPKYFNAFLSCNEAYKTASGTKLPAKKWCGECPKCLFVFVILYPFVKEKKLLKIFGKNLFEDPEGKPLASYGVGKKLLPIMQQLIGVGSPRGFKPFECVGTRKESLIAFYLSWKKTKEIGNIPVLLKYFEKNILKKYPNLEKEVEKLLDSWNSQNNLPKEFKEILHITSS